MAGNVYSNYELAQAMAQSRMAELEQDVFICHVQYKSGEEFVLKIKDELISGGCFIDHIKLPIKHHFKDMDNAVTKALQFTKAEQKKIGIAKITYKENGYNKLDYYLLMDRKPDKVDKEGTIGNISCQKVDYKISKPDHEDEIYQGWLPIYNKEYEPCLT